MTDPLLGLKLKAAFQNPFLRQRGTRQSCLASPIFFALFMEPLTQWIRHTETIKGKNVVTEEHKLALFADDVLLYSAQPTQTIPILMRI